MTIVSRVAWGARKPKSRSTGALSAKSTGHWNGPTVTIGGKTEWDHSRCPSLVRGIQNFHMDGRGWADIAYNFVVCPHGTIFEGRGLNVRNGANGTNKGNMTSHAIMWLSGERNPFTESEKRGFKECSRYIDEKTAAPAECIGHRDHKATACPGNERYNWIHAGMPVSGTSVPNTKPTQDDILELGDSGDGVEDLKAMLNILAKERIPSVGKGHGAQLPMDPSRKYFGQMTQEAVREFQRFLVVMWELAGKKGPKPTVDGKAGPQTLSGIAFWVPIVLKNR